MSHKGAFSAPSYFLCTLMTYLTVYPILHYSFLQMTPNAPNRSSIYQTLPCCRMILMVYLFGPSMNPVSKCALISFCRAHPHFTQSYLLNNQEITRCHHHKDLGVIWCNNLSWSDHIQYISARAYKMLGLLRRTFSRYNSHHSKKLLYIHLVRSQLIYCSQIWRPYLLKDITVLENVQRRGTKFILNDFTADYKTRLLSLNLLPLAMLYELNDILFFILSSLEFALPN